MGSTSDLDPHLTLSLFVVCPFHAPTVPYRVPTVKENLAPQIATAEAPEYNTPIKDDLC